VIEIEVDVADLTQVRFTTDAVWETTASIHALVFLRHHLLHQRLRRLVPKRPDFDLEHLLTLARNPDWLPDVWAPAPSPRPGHPLDQLAALRDTDPAVAEADLRQLRTLWPGSAAATMRPQEYLDRTADALQGWWTTVLEPLWDRVDAIQRADIAHHQTALATRGLAATLRELHRGLSFRGDRLRVELGEGLVSLKSCGRGIWFMPSVFRWPWVALDTRETVPPVVSYGARGAGRVWQPTGRETPAGLPDLIGRSRALILESLDLPRSTTSVARSLGLSVSTVSEHLSVLAAAGLLESRRDGQRVLYWRTVVGDLLVDGESAARLLG
jgi:DNA-binding transcriptional ArsR family regulator